MEVPGLNISNPVINKEAKKAKGLLVPGAVLLILLVGVFTYGFPKLNETLSLFGRIDSESKSIENLKEKNKVLVSENSPSLQSEITLLNSALPSSKDAIGLVAGMQRLSAENGLVMQTIQVAPGKLRFVQNESSASATPQISAGTAAAVTADEVSAVVGGGKKVEGVEMFDFQAQLVGPYAQVEQFLAAFPLTLRLIDLTQINISAEGADRASGTVRVLIAGVAYYKTLPSTLPDPKSPVVKLSREDMDAIGKIKSFRVVSSLPDLKDTGTVENPF